MIPTVAVIPSRYEPQRLRALVEQLVAEAEVIVLDNGHEPPLTSFDPRVRVVDARGDGIYRMWNRGWQLARELAPVVDVAILNDDIRINQGTLPLLARALRADERLGAVYPDPSAPLRRGLPRSLRFGIDWDPAGPRNLTGYCFMFKGELQLPPFDEGYGWWYGDTQFDESIRLAGYGVACIRGLPIEHRSDSEANDWARRPELKQIVEEDGARWAELHVEIRDGKWWPISEMVP